MAAFSERQTLAIHFVLTLTVVAAAGWWWVIAPALASPPTTGAGVAWLLFRLGAVGTIGTAVAFHAVALAMLGLHYVLWLASAAVGELRGRWS